MIALTHSAGLTLFATAMLLAVAPPNALALRLSWLDGSTDLSVAQSGRATLLLNADSAEAALPAEWRLVWCADSSGVRFVPQVSPSGCATDTAAVATVAEPASHADSVTNQVTPDCWPGRTRTLCACRSSGRCAAGEVGRRHMLAPRACAWLLGMALGLGPPCLGRTQTIDPKPWAVDTYGAVSAIARSTTTIYLGGNFSAVGPVTGQGVPVNRTTGEPLADYPVVSGTIKAVLADGRGGWYIGGGITRVGGEARSGLAHIGADGQVMPWAPAVTGVVQTMALSGDTLFVGGGFTAVAGESRGRGAAFDVRTGVLLAWDPLADGEVLALAVDGADVFLGGRFGNLGTAARPRVGAVERELGNATGWSPQVVAGKVEALAVRGGEVYVGGEYDESHAVLAAVDRSTGAALLYDWAVAERRPGCDRCGYVPFVQALVVADGRLYIAGSFTHIGGEARLGMASVDLTTGKVTAWNPLIHGPAPLP